jgi:hypothetical protein
MLLRAIAWAGKRPIDALMTVRRGGRMGGPPTGETTGRSGRGGM